MERKFQDRLVVGLTGSIGSGKSTVARLFEKNGYFYIDSDQLAKRYTANDSPIKDLLRKIFDGSIFLEDGNIDRKKIASIVFKDSELLKKLELILHPLVLKDALAVISSLPKDSKIIWEIPLLFETGMEIYCDFVITVFSDFETSFRRVEARNQFTKEEFLERYTIQMSIKEKIKRSDYSIENGLLQSLGLECDTIMKDIEQRVI